MTDKISISQLASKLVAICACILLALLLPIVTGQRAGAQEVQNDEPKYNVVLLIDESGSMWCPRCNDEESPNFDVIKKDDWIPLYITPPMRIKAVEGLLANMAVEPKVTNFNVGIVAFESTANNVAELQPVSDQANLINMMKALYANHENTFEKFKQGATRGLLRTNTPAAIDQAYQMLFTPEGVARAPGKNVVLMISDGVPLVTGNDKTEQQGKAAQQIQRLTAAKADFISLLIFNSDPNVEPAAKVDAVDRDFWSNIAKGPGLNQACGYWEVENSKLLFQSTQAILRCILTDNTTQPPVVQLTPRQPEKFGVESVIKDVSITIRKNDPRTVVKVFRPDGRELPKTENGNDVGDNLSYRKVGSSESYFISHPSNGTSSWAGCWTVAMETAIEADQTVPVEVALAAYTADYSLTFNQLGGGWQVGKPLKLDVGILNNSGQAVSPASLQLTSALSLGIQRPDGVSNTISLQVQGSSYTDNYVGETQGVYTFTAALNAVDLLKPSSSTAGCVGKSIVQGQPGQITSQRQVRMELLPWLNLSSPKEGEEVNSDRFKAQAQVMLGTAGATDDTLVKGDVKAQIVSRSDNTVVKAYVLQRDATAGAGMYSRQPSDISKLPSGDYSLIVSFNGKIANDTAVLTDTAQVDFKLIQVLPTVTPTFTSTPTNTPAPPIAVPSSPTPTATPTVPITEDSGDFPWWILGVLGVLGLGGLGFLIWRSITGAARLDGLRLDPSSMGAPILLRGKQATHSLGSANLQFVATNPTGMPTMTILSAPEQVNVNGSPYNQGNKVTLGINDKITVGSETYTLAGISRAGRSSKSTPQVEDYGGISSGDYSGY
jgi:hypothetical protein